MLQPDNPNLGREAVDPIAERRAKLLDRHNDRLAELDEIHGEEFETVHNGSGRSEELPADLTRRQRAERAHLQGKQQEELTVFDREHSARLEGGVISTWADLDAIWETATAATDDHPYLKQHNIRAHGLRQDEAGGLLVPVTDSAGELSNIERIDETGTRSFLSAEQPVAGQYLLGALARPDALVITTRFETAATINELTGTPAAVAFTTTNLVAIAETYREEHPDCPIFVAADEGRSDPAMAGELERLFGSQPGHGHAAAISAASAVDGYAIQPPNLDGKVVDWSTYALEKPGDASEQLKAAMLQAEWVLDHARGLQDDRALALEAAEERSHVQERDSRDQHALAQRSGLATDNAEDLGFSR